jgi:hypothetical protein
MVRFLLKFAWECITDVVNARRSDEFVTTLKIPQGLKPLFAAGSYVAAKAATHKSAGPAQA